MSENAREVTSRHFQYIADHSASADDAFLRDLKISAEAAGIPRIWIAPEQAAFFDVLLRATGARRVVEVGTLAGYAAIRMARALPEGGLVDTIEVDALHARFARHQVAASDVADRVRVHEGDAREVLAGLPDDRYDVAFIDADKENYSVYLDHCLRIVRVGGTILVDNAFAFGQLFDETVDDPSVRAIRECNERIAAHPQMRSILMPFGDGCWMGVRLR